jgi:hypothetical protein
VTVVVFEATPLMLIWWPLIAALLQHCASADNTALLPTSCHCRRCACQRMLDRRHVAPSPQGRATVITSRRGT